MDLDQVQAFLTLSEELHFGRTADRMYRSQPRISRMIASLETEIGAALFERTSRRVSLTPLGAQLEARLRPAYTELLAARDAARRAARDAAGQLRVAFTSTTEGPGLAGTTSNRVWPASQLAVWWLAPLAGHRSYEAARCLLAEGYWRVLGFSCCLVARAGRVYYFGLDMYSPQRSTASSRLPCPRCVPAALRPHRTDGG